MTIPLSSAVVLSLFLVTSFCPPQKSDVERTPLRRVTIADLLERPSQYADQVVRLEGFFQGFRITECRFPAAARQAGLTRSDWLFRTGQDCLWVTGGAPPEIDRVDPSYVGRRVELDARLIEKESGKFLLKYVRGRLLAERTSRVSRPW